MPSQWNPKRGTVFGRLKTKTDDAFAQEMEKARGREADGLSAVAMEWISNRRVIKSVPQDFRLPLRVIRRSDGLRQIVPGCNPRDFLIRAAAGGLGLLQRVKQPTADVLQTYRLMTLLFQWSFSNRCLMSRTIRRAEDLELRRSERDDSSKRDILPEITLTKSEYSSERLTPDQLLKRGRESARERGIPSVSTFHQINLGLLATARHSPNLVNPSNSESIKSCIRLNLFGLNQGERIDDVERIALIEERLLEAVRKHLDLADAEFRKWMWGDFANIVWQLAKRKAIPGGPFSPDQVRFVLFDLLWRSFGYVSDCVRLQMQAVRLAIHPAFSEQERHVFGLWYDAQPWVAGLAPVVLHNQFGLLLPTLADLEAPGADSEQFWQAFSLAMYWSSEMAANRRCADVNQKKHKRCGFSNSFDHEFLNEDHDPVWEEANFDSED